MTVRHDPERDAGQEERERGVTGRGRHARRWSLWLLLVPFIAAGAAYVITHGCDSAPSPVVKPPAPTAHATPTAPEPPAFEDIVLEVDPAKFMESCLAAGGTEAECQATLGDLRL